MINIKEMIVRKTEEIDDPTWQDIRDRDDEIRQLKDQLESMKREATISLFSRSSIMDTRGAPICRALPDDIAGLCAPNPPAMRRCRLFINVHGSRRL